MNKSGLRVHIKCSDSGWILERLATELRERLDYVDVGADPDRLAPVQYYLNYAEHHERISPLEFAWFTHIEERDENLVAKFHKVSTSVDVALCHSKKYAELLSARGLTDVHVIEPGVDLQQFTPKLKIGVVGRTYPSGRKGEHLLAAVADVAGIEWHFSGEGWFGRARPLAASEMPDFYRGVDYILVSSLYEGGPMCVVEALASGTPVIAPPVGWVPQFPHIEYATGDVADLRRVLEQLLAEKRALRASVENLTWDNYAAAHDNLFKYYYDRKFPKGMSSRRMFRFEKIYSDKEWGGAFAVGAPVFSGEGSLPQFSLSFVDSVRKFCANNGVKKILDLGCGDFQVGKMIIDGMSIDYCGVDISTTVIQHNVIRYANKGVEFCCADIVVDALPEADLIVLRQVLQHLSNETIAKVLERVANYPNVIICDEIRPNVEIPNVDIEDGGANRVNYESSLLLEHPPFSARFATLSTSESHRAGNILRTIILYQEKRPERHAKLA